MGVNKSIGNSHVGPNAGLMFKSTNILLLVLCLFHIPIDDEIHEGLIHILDIQINIRIGHD